MSTPVDQMADTLPVESQEVPTVALPRRRFAPKRSRSSGPAEPSVDAEVGSVEHAAVTASDNADTVRPAGVKQNDAVPKKAKTGHGASSRSTQTPLRPSSRGTSVVVDSDDATPAPIPHLELSPDSTSPDEARVTESPATHAPARPGRVRPPRRRGTAQPLTANSSTSVDAIVGSTVEGGQPDAEAARLGNGPNAPEASSVVSDPANAAALKEPVSGDSAAKPRAARPSRSRRRPSHAAPTAMHSTDPLTGVASELPEAEVPEDQRRDPYDSWRMDTNLTVSAPGGDFDGTEALARELLEMFTKSEPAPVADSEVAVADMRDVPDMALTAAVEAPAAPAEEIQDSEGALAGESDATLSEEVRRRSRRGRRGGRGRRRGAALVEDTSSDDIAEVVVSGESATPVAIDRPTGPLQAPSTSLVPGSLFDAGEPLGPSRSWRDRGPQRRWDRTFPRQTQTTVAMPPPKPSNGARFAPIPQALPPRSDTAVTAQTVARALLPFEMPDLRVGEPLGPGETRTERLLEVQTRLLQAMLEGQARQLEALTSSVAGLHQAVRDISATSGSRTYQPRTGIFVDAPNVCYAADNARVNLDFGRMLKYLARDRHIVHALSYSPIIDDVREGIRYETQRFVAPFLRAGYKLVTKPLKRFSDGSAKGNFDIELALDIITMAKRLDVVVLVSGDSDFESVIEHIQSNGVRVEVVAFASNVSTELVNVADTFIDIGQHLEHFRQV